MVRLLLMILCGCLPVSGFAQHQLQLVVGNTEVELGNAINVDLYAINSKVKINSLELSKLGNDFRVIKVNSGEVIEDSRWPGKAVQYLNLKLFPYTSGEFVIPVLNLGQASSKTKSVHVLPASRNKIPLKVSTQVSNFSPWQRQQVIVSFEVLTSDKFASLIVDDSFKLPGFAIHSLAQQRIPLPDKQGGNTTRIRSGWAIFPLLSGERQLQLPAIKYQIDGVKRKSFYLPGVSLTVRQLPPYVPPTMPVGAVSLRSELTTPSFWQTDTLSFWNIELSAQSIPARWLPPVLRQIKSNQRIQFSPAQSHPTDLPDLDGVHGKIQHRIPFKALANGYLALPEIRLQYFDPDSGRLVPVRHRVAVPMILDTTWRLLIGAACLAILAIALKNIVDYWQRIATLVKKRNTAKRLVRNARDVDTVRRGLKILAESEGWQANLSLHAWRTMWEKYYQEDENVNGLIDALSRACYREGDNFSLAELQQQLLKIINSNRYRWLWRVLRPGWAVSP